MCAVLYKFAYRRILEMLEQRRQQIALGIANAEKIKAELDKTESKRLEVIARAHIQGSKFIEEALPQRPAYSKRETKAVAAAEEIMNKAREAAAQDHDRMLAELCARSAI